MQYQENGWVGIVFTILCLIFVMLNIKRAKTKNPPQIRKIPGLSAIKEAVERATEMGKPILMVPGIGGLDVVSIQALNIFSYITRIAARFATPIRICCIDPAVYTLAEEIISETYRSEGFAERYDPDSIRFISDRQFAFAAGVAGIIYQEQVAATFYLGEFFAESLILAEAANTAGAIQIAGSTRNMQTPFFIAACDYVLISDEFYAASASLTKEPVFLGSIVGQDWCKLLVGFSILLGVLVNSYLKVSPAWSGEAPPPDQNLMMYRLFTTDPKK